MGAYYSFDSWDSELYHHGIKGQKWGIRRYQNEDGSLTKAGQKHYGIKPGDRLTITRKQDVDAYGRKGADRIQNRIKKKGMTRKKAERRELFRQIGKNVATSLAISFISDEILNGGIGRKAIGAIVRNEVNRRAKEYTKRESIMKLPITAINAYVAKTHEYKIK